MKTICLFAGYDKLGNIEDYVKYYIEKLSEFSDVYYCGDFDPQEGELEKLSPYTKDAIAFRHERYDYGSWDELVKKIGWNNIQKYDRLILANDSCYGPLYPFNEVFEYMEKRNCDFWGLSCGKGYHIHIQSYFLVFNKNVLKSDCIPSFLSTAKPRLSLKEVCELYEDQFTYYLKKHGFTYDSYIPYGEFELHPYYETWNCIYKKRFPLLKVKVFDGCVGFDSVKSWKKFIRDYTDYDVNLIIDNLHHRGYRDSDIDLAVKHWNKYQEPNKITVKIKSFPKKIVKKMALPFWKRYMNRFDYRFLETRMILENDIQSLKRQIQGIERRLTPSLTSISKGDSSNDIVSFFKKYGLVSPLDLDLKVSKKNINHIDSIRDNFVTCESIIHHADIPSFIQSILEIPMYRKLEQISLLCCGKIEESSAIEFLLRGINVTLLNSNIKKTKTIEYELLRDSLYQIDLMSDFSFLKENSPFFFDLILINQLESDVNSGELLNLLYNFRKNMLDESILIVSIPHTATIMDEFNDILDEVGLYWNQEYQGVLEKYFSNMESFNCLVLMKKETM